MSRSRVIIPDICTLSLSNRGETLSALSLISIPPSLIPPARVKMLHQLPIFNVALRGLCEASADSPRFTAFCVLPNQPFYNSSSFHVPFSHRAFAHAVLSVWNPFSFPKLLRSPVLPLGKLSRTLDTNQVS